MKRPEADENSADVEQWERDLEKEVHSVNASRRTPPYVRMNWDHVRETVESLGIDQERAERLVLAADAGFRWDTAINILERRGMGREDAEDAVESIAHHILAGRTMDDAPFEEARERKKLLWSIAGIALLTIGIGAWIFV